MPSDSTFEIEDPGEFNQRTRLKNINDARQRVRQYWELVETDGQDTPEDADRVLYTVVNGFLSEIEWLMVNNDATNYLHEETIGEFQIGPPHQIETLVKDDTVRIIGTPNLDPVTIKIKGIHGPQDPANGTVYGFMNAPTVFQRDYSVHADVRHEEADTYTQTAARVMPKHISIAAFRLGCRFLAEAGLDARIKDEIDAEANPY